MFKRVRIRPWSTNLQVTQTIKPNLSHMATELLSPAIVRRTRCRCTLRHSDDTSREGHCQGRRGRFKRCCAAPDGYEKTLGTTGQRKRGGGSKTTRKNPCEEASVHAVTQMDITLTWQTGTWRERCSKQGAGILIWEKLRTPEITCSVPVDGLCITTTMSTAGRFTGIRHTSQDPLLCAAERQMAKGKRRTTANCVTWCVSAKESNVIGLVGPVSRVNSVNQEVYQADKDKTDNAGQPPWHPELDVSQPRTAATWAF